MLKNYLIIATRQLFKSKSHSIINIGGLAIGLSAVFLIALYVEFEYSYEKDLKHADQLYRLNLTSFNNGEKEEASARTAPAMGSTFKNELTAVEDYTRAVILGDVIVGNDNTFIRENDIFLVDEKYLDFFDVSIESGSAAKMIEPLKVMISEETASTIFRSENPVGKLLSINSIDLDGTVDFEIIGVFNNVPSNRHLKPQILISYATLHHFIGKQIDQSFNWLNLYTFLKLNPAANKFEVEKQINTILAQHHGEKLKSSNTNWKLQLQSVKDIHTQLEYVGEYELGVDGKKIQYFIWVGIVILIMIYVNSVNITNTKALNRSKEIGVRKVSGGSNRQIFLQIFLETLLVNLIAIVIAIILIKSAGSFIAGFFDLNILKSFSVSNYWAEIILLWLWDSLLSAIYPSIILTSFSPAHALKGTLKFKLKGAFSRPLIVIQLIICLIILAGTLTVYRQVDFMRKQSTGISLEDKVIIRSPMVYVEGSGSYQKVLYQNFMQLNGVKNIAATNEIPGNEVYWRSNEFFREGGEKNGTMFSTLDVGDHYFDIFSIKLKAGKYFNTDLEDGSEAIINEKARKALGFKDNQSAVGKKLMFSGHGDAIGVEIVGVVGDYHQQGVNVPVGPLVLNFSSKDLNYYIVELENGHIDKNLEAIEAKFKSLFPASPFEYYFLDEHYDKQYKSEKQFAKLFLIAAFITILIAMMGILGVTTQLIIQKNKEVSIRKILGASFSNIFYLISREFIMWLLICFIVGIPLSYYLFSSWLDNFLVKINLEWWFFIIPGMLVALIFIVSTIFQTVKTALINPAETLKDE